MQHLIRITQKITITVTDSTISMPGFRLAFAKVMTSVGGIGQSTQQNEAPVAHSLFQDTTKKQPDSTEAEWVEGGIGIQLIIQPSSIRHTYQLRFIRQNSSLGMQLLAALERLVDLALEEQTL